MVSEAYACICTGVSAALRIGLHVSSSAFQNRISKDELTKRRVVFAVLYSLDTGMSSMLGMPNILRDADPDQIVAVPEPELADEGANFVQVHPHAPVSETILSTKLYRILVRDEGLLVVNQSNLASSY